jgi:hypothetical protein
VRIIWLLEWSDDFEPNAINKNRGSMWINTVTICPPHSNLHSMTCILPLAMGLKKASYEAAEKKFAEEIASLSQQSATDEMYSKRHKRMVIVFVAILVASLMDQTEKRDMCCLSLGGSCFGGR